MPLTEPQVEAEDRGFPCREPPPPLMSKAGKARVAVSLQEIFWPGEPGAKSSPSSEIRIPAAALPGERTEMCQTTWPGLQRWPNWGVDPECIHKPAWRWRQTRR